MLRPEPFPCPSFRAMTKVGLWNRSTTREATMPMTPGCQASLASTSPRVSGPPSSSAWATASRTMRRSSACRSLFA